MADIQAAKINHDNHLLLDQACLRLPYELLRQNFRSFHVPFDKNHNAVKDLLKDTANGSLNGKASPEDVVKNLDQMLVKMRGLKRKLTAAADEENRLYRQMNARVAHLRELAELNTVDDVKYEAWSRQRLDRLLVDYMLRHGYDASAIALADERGMQDLVDIDTFVTMSKIRKSLEGGSVQEALAWCGENKKELRKMQSNLEFMLRCQQYIEMMRTGSQAKMLEAINHARKHITPFSESYPLEVSNMAGLLACQPDTDLEPYASLYNSSRWAKLAEAFVEAYLKLLNLPMTPLLHIALSSGLSALKTPACHSTQSRPQNEDQTATDGATTAAPSSTSNPSSSAPTHREHHRHHHRHHNHNHNHNHNQHPHAPDNNNNNNNNNHNHNHPTNPAHHGTASLTTRVCPICSTELNALARGVRYAHHTKSRLLEHDLVLLPNGRVYGRARLDEHAAKSGLDPAKTQQVKDLVTGEVFGEGEIRKVFVT